MDITARGTFEVTSHAEPPFDTHEGVSLGRMTIDKVFSGDLQGTGHVHMLTAGGPVKGSGAYVALERLEGTLHGKRGSFVCHHTGVMDRGNPGLAIHIVPDSGTGDFQGIRGGYSIDMHEGKHHYVLTCSLP